MMRPPGRSPARPCGGVAAAVAVAALAGCPAPPPAPPPPAPVAPQQPSSTDELLRDLEAAVLSGYQQLALGNVEAYADGIAHGVDVGLIGMSAGDVVLGIDPPGAYADRRLFRDHDDLELVSKNLHVFLSRDESVGWTSDEVSYRIPVPVVHDGQVVADRVASIPIRTTAAWVRDIDRWVEVAEHVSYPLPPDRIVELLRARRLAAPAPLRSSGSGDPQIDERTAAQIRAVIERLHGPDPDLSNLVVGDRRTLILWPSPDAEYAGARAAQAPPLAALFGAGARVRVVDFRACARVGTVVWAVANLAVDLGGSDTGSSAGMRGSYLLEARKIQAEWRWQVVQAHVSVPLSQGQVEGYVFGAPEAPAPGAPPPG